MVRPGRLAQRLQLIHASATLTHRNMRPALCLNSGQDLTQIFHLTSHVQSFDKQKPAVYHHH